MDLWFNDEHTDTVKLSVKVEKQLFSGQSEEQQIDVLETREFGKILAVDGDIMLTQKDEFIYHELLVHVPMAVNPDIKEILVIGGGDGGTVRELTRYSTIENIDLVEIDEEVAKNFIDGFLDEYNTLNNRYFKTHSGEVVYVKKGTYGNKIDLEREEEFK